MSVERFGAGSRGTSRLIGAGLALSLIAASAAAPRPAVPGQVVAQPDAQGGGQPGAAQKMYKIEILSAAGKPRRRKNMVSSESVIRVTDSNDVPVAGIAVMFSLSNLSGGSAAFANGATSTIVTTNAAGVAATGNMTASATSSFSIGVSASVPGQAPVTATIPVNMATAVAGGAAGGAAAGGAAGAGAGVSGAVIGVVVAAGAAAAVVAAKTLGGGGGSTPPPTSGPPPAANPRIRIGGAGTPTVTGPQ